MLDFNLSSEEKRESAGWKLLVYDQFGRDVLAPLLNVAELRRLGITLHLCVHPTDSYKILSSFVRILPRCL
jgi:hypothetical protein